MKKNNFIFLSLISIILATSCNNNRKDLDQSKGLNLINEFIVYDSLDDVNNEDCKVVLLYGQSNATGCTNSSFLKDTNRDLYYEFLEGYENVYINYNTENYNHSSAQFVQCALGCGMNNFYFGPECGIAKVLSEYYKDEKVFIIKYSYGGTTLATQWLNGYSERGGLYNCSINYTKVSLDYLIEKGYNPDIIGICWMQGENDACNEDGNYYEDTKNLVSYYREDLKDYDTSFRFVDAYISNTGTWPYHKRVNDAKYQYSTESENNYLIDTFDLTTNLEPEESPDTAHYDSLSMAILGQRFGENLIK